MKRLGSSDSLGGLMSICPNSTVEHIQGNNPMYTREFQTTLGGLDDEGCIIESGHVSEKKRRLSVDQVKALEKSFEVENKLEPERKVKLAQELGLQPRQVAVWFQNRRARWKTKQMERDYGVLKANYDGLKLNVEKLRHENDSLLKEIRELKSKLNEDNSEKCKLETLVNSLDKSDEDATEIENLKSNKNIEMLEGVSVFGDFKDGSSDSDSSAILNEDNNNSPTTAAAAAAISSTAGGIIHHSPHPFLNGSSTSYMNTSFQFSEMEDEQRTYPPQFVKIEEHNFFGEESCTTFFSDDQAPTLHWVLY